MGRRRGNGRIEVGAVVGERELVAMSDDPVRVPDPDKRLYREFGVESSLLSVLHPRAWPAEIRGLRGKRRKFSVDLHGGPLGLPADFLIAPDGRALARRYGGHAYDQWSVDDLLGLAREHQGKR